MSGTKEIAEQIVEYLVHELKQYSHVELKSVRSIFICGSYVRGDWLDSSSDLDIHVLYQEGQTDAELQKADFARIQEIVHNRKEACRFDSQIPGGIDWGTLPYLPRSSADVSVPNPYVYYSAFYFDFVHNLKIIWGEDFREKLPVGPPPSALSIPNVGAFLQRIIQYDRSHNRRRAAFLAYKGALLAQILFGKPTIDKREVRQLYEQYVPDYPEKKIGCSIIDQYLTSVYPENPPKFEPVSYYRDYLAGTLECMQREQL